MAGRSSKQPPGRVFTPDPDAARVLAKPSRQALVDQADPSLKTAAAGLGLDPCMITCGFARILLLKRRRTATAVRILKPETVQDVDAQAISCLEWRRGARTGRRGQTCFGLSEFS